VALQEPLIQLPLVHAVCWSIVQDSVVISQQAPSGGGRQGFGEQVAPGVQTLVAGQLDAAVGVQAMDWSQHVPSWVGSSGEMAFSMSPAR
jgi:hypothetical protein